MQRHQVENAVGRSDMPRPKRALTRTDALTSDQIATITQKALDKIS